MRSHASGVAAAVGGKRQALELGRAQEARPWSDGALVAAGKHGWARARRRRYEHEWCAVLAEPYTEVSVR